MTAALIASQRARPSQVFHKTGGPGSQSPFHHTHESTVSANSLDQEPSVANHLILLGGILTLGNLADIIHKSSRVYLFQQAQCLLYYHNVDPTKIPSNFRIDEALCKVSPVQSRLATVDGVDSFLSCLPRELLLDLNPISKVSFTQLVTFWSSCLMLNLIAGADPLPLTVALLVLATYRELLPRVGLRRLVLLNLLCSGLEVLYSIFVCMWPSLFCQPTMTAQRILLMIGHSLASSRLGDAGSSPLIRLQPGRWRGHSPNHHCYQVYCRYLTT